MSDLRDEYPQRLTVDHLAEQRAALPRDFPLFTPHGDYIGRLDEIMRDADLDEALAAERRATVERLHDLLMQAASAGYTYGALGRDFAGVLPELRRIEDAEADRNGT